MENYKLVNFDGFEDKAKRLGLDKTAFTGEDPFILIQDKNYVSGRELWKYNDSDATEITQTDFLALPEPIKKGDWVKCRCSDWNGFTIDQIKEVVEINGKPKYILNDGESFDGDETVKLSPEQIKILELEE